jgi:hypothetical protein
MQVPSNLLLNKLGKPSLYLPTCMVIWGLISGLTAACQNYGGLIACRFMLGFIEAAYFVSYVPRLVFLLIMYYSLGVCITFRAGIRGKNWVSELQCSILAP